nr:GGDEF domain-containing protein [Alcanivorax sp. 1008]
MSDLAKRANRDQLTGALNRHGGEGALEQLAASGSCFAAMMVDIDHFKDINDTYGHDVGDEVIKLVTARIRDSLRDHDFLIRWGGEEFLLLIPGADEGTAIKIGQRVLDRVRRHQGVASGRATVSVGVAMHQPGLDGKRTVKAADEALYQAKRAGRDRMVVAPGGGLIEKQSAVV